MVVDEVSLSMEVKELLIIDIGGIQSGAMRELRGKGCGAVTKKGFGSKHSLILYKKYF